MKSRQFKIIFALIFFPFLTWSQEIKSKFYYYFHDTTGINFSDTSLLFKNLTNKTTYDTAGRIVQQLDYPFPHDRDNYLGTRIDYYYVHDTVIETKHTFKGDLVSKKLTIKSNNKIKSISERIFGVIESNIFRAYDDNRILIIEYDSTTRMRHTYTIKPNNGNYDTLNNNYYNSASSNNNLAEKTWVSLGKIESEVISSSGIMEFNKSDTVEIRYDSEIIVKPGFTIQENIRLDKVNHIISKKEIFTNHSKVVREAIYYFHGSFWNLFEETNFIYNNRGDLKFRISNAFRNGKLDHRNVTYFSYDYYR